MQNAVIVPISLPKEMAKEVDKMAKNEAMTRSEFIRDVLRRKLAFTQLGEFRNEFSAKAKKAGIRTLQDAVRAVREIRDKK